MMKNEISKLRDILVATFPNSVVPADVRDLKIGDLEEWDSVGNFNFLLAVEEEYKIRMDIEEMSNIKSIKDVVSILDQRS